MNVIDNIGMLPKNLAKKIITINDRILFRTIFDVLSTLFTNEDGMSTLSNGYNINVYQRLLFLIITPNSKS